MAKIMLEIECSDEFCELCDLKRGDICPPFGDVQLEGVSRRIRATNRIYDFKRLPECIAAEKSLNDLPEET